MVKKKLQNAYIISILKLQHGFELISQLIMVNRHGDCVNITLKY